MVKRTKAESVDAKNSFTLSVCGVAEGAEGRTKRDRIRRNRTTNDEVIGRAATLGIAQKRTGNRSNDALPVE